MKTEFYGHPDYEEEYWELEVGQVWVPEDDNDYTLEIVHLTDEMATVKQIETGETFEHELDGSDTFADYLMCNNYHLKS